ncbi:MAG: ABC transporter ATP-binding protein [Bacteroidota bacterium]
MPPLFQKLSYLFSRHEKRNALVLFGMMIVGALLEVVGVGAIPAFIGVLAIPEQLLENERVRMVYDALGLESPEQMAFWAAGALIAVFVFKNAYLAFMAYVQARYTSNRQVAISNRLFRAYLHSPYTFHLQRNTAELLRNTNSEAGSITRAVLMPILNLMMETIVLVFIFALLFVVEPVVTIAAFGVLGSIVYAFWKGTRRKIDDYARIEQDRRRVSVQSVNQGLGGFKDARILGREGFFLDTYAESNWMKAEAARFKAVVGALPRLFLEITAIVGILGVTLFLMAQGRPMETVVPTLALLGVAIVRLMPSFQKVAANISARKWGERSLNVVYDDLRELEDLDRARRARLGAEDASPLLFEREIRLEGLSYSYPGQAGQALDDVSLTIPKGASVGFIGPSGAGKTTVVDVILGLLTPDAGQVLVDDTDVQTRLATWQRKIGYIPQSIYLTDNTVRRNVAFGREDDEISDDDVWRALDAAQLRETVEALPDGLDTVIGERGARLSGGQRQRVGIARALYHRPEVLIMDEATSALDNETERQFVDALERLQGDHTMLVIAHRLSTVRGCDTLFMLDQGRLVAEGSYDELLATSDAFRQMAGVDEGAAVAG